jgi:hypothetical protein
MQEALEGETRERVDEGEDSQVEKQEDRWRGVCGGH